MTHWDFLYREEVDMHWNIAAQWMWIRRKLSLRMSRPSKLGKTKVQPAAMRSQRHMHQRFNWRINMAKPKRYSGDELHARLIFTVGLVLAFVFAISVIGFVYALMFVTQPLSSQAPNDAAFIDLLKTLTVFLTGSLGGLVMSNGMKGKKKEDSSEETNS